MNYSKCIVLAGLAIILVNCDRKIDLEPTDKRPVKSIKIDDAEEAALIEQELDIEVKYIANNTLYFYSEDQNVLSKLEEIGYQIANQTPIQTSFKMLKLLSKRETSMTKEKNPQVFEELQKNNIKVFNREKDYWVIYGSLENLSVVRNLGYVYENLETEIHPRSIKITVYSIDDIQRVNEFNVDIYSTRQNDNYYVIYGGAYDYQIDLLKAEEYQVEIEN